MAPKQDVLETFGDIIIMLSIGSKTPSLSLASLGSKSWEPEPGFKTLSLSLDLNPRAYEILCKGSSDSIGWALSLSLSLSQGSKPASLSLGSKTVEPQPQPKAPKVSSSRA
jgi:hypothetical protein